MTGKQKFLLVVVVALVLTILGRLFLNSPVAHIQLAAETVFPDTFGGKWDITNSIIAAWAAMGLLIIMALLAIRKQSMVPKGWYNFVEATIGGILGMVESIAGKKNGRMFFPLIATIFIFIVVANWMALTPVFATIGKVETAEYILMHEVEEAISEVLDRPISESNLLFVEAYEHDVEAFLESPAYKVWLEGDPETSNLFPEPPEIVKRTLLRQAGDNRLVIFDGDSGTRMIPVGYKKVKEIRLAEYWNFDEWQRRTGDVDSDGNTVNIDGKTVGRLLPYLRSMNTDIMNPLALALIAMTMVTVWGMRANGFFNYMSRFINFKEGPLGFALGILEIVGEFAKVISFTFRLLGNMFAGEILILSILFLLPIMAGVFVFPFLLEVFVGVIQGVVFAALTLVFAVLAVTPHGKHEEHSEGQ